MSANYVSFYGSSDMRLVEASSLPVGLTLPMLLQAWMGTSSSMRNEWSHFNCTQHSNRSLGTRDGAAECRLLCINEIVQIGLPSYPPASSCGWLRRSIRRLLNRKSRLPNPFLK